MAKRVVKTRPLTRYERIKMRIGESRTRNDMVARNVWSSVVAECFKVNPYGTIIELAVAAGLGTQTVANLRDGVTRTPYGTTIFKLCLACGVEYRINGRGELAKLAHVRITQEALDLAKVA